jgi:Fe-S-cluster containining protein
MSSAPTSPCSTCGACCRAYLVPVSGYDIWLLSTRQHLDPAEFLVAYPMAEVDLAAVRLEANEPHTHLIVLDKRAHQFALDQPCIFLLTLADGTTRCGVYADRPSTCRSYPMAAWDEVVFQRKEALCPPDSWPAAEVLRPVWRQNLQRFHMHLDIYREVTGRWNARVAARPRVRFTLQEFYSYVLNVYDRLAALDAALDDDRLARVRTGWPTLPRPSADLAALQAPDGTWRVPLGERPWLDYLTQARQVIDSFYPELAPQPLRILEPLHLDTLLTPAAPPSP